jgi:putative peptidoglycan lipid II flippase
MFLSKIAGFVRGRYFARFLGADDAADAFGSAFRIPNLLQNLFGEGVLSASFIPVYASLLARGEVEEAGRVAGAVLAILGLVTSVLTLLGILATPLLVDVITYGFHGAKRELTIRLVRILFPGAALLVMSAWCLGILNSPEAGVKHFFVEQDQTPGDPLVSLRAELPLHHDAAGDTL